MNGVILIDKPMGKTSHDMVYFVRRLTGIKKVGHTGTLDPDATGVLPVCIGKATKACDMLTASDKEYIAEIAFGKTTDTQDASGQVLTECEVTSTAEEIELAIKSFIGEISQIPPMFSAIKKDGKKLYELARQGISVEREARMVNIHNIEIIGIDMSKKTAQIRVACSKGTYIRTLCEDIGAKLGCGAYMQSLRRTKSGIFDISQCRTCEQLLQIKENDGINGVIIPVDRLFDDYESVILDDFLSGKLKNGIKIRRNGLENDAVYRVYDNKGSFLALSRYNGSELVSEKTFWS